MTVTVPAFDASDIAIQSTALSLWFGERQVIDAVSLSIPKGQVTAIIGASGSGKSSLLRCFNRLNDDLDGHRVQGRIMLDGIDLHGPNLPVHELRRRVGMVFQRPNPFPMSIGDNVAFGLHLLGIRKGSECDGRVEAALKSVGLWAEVVDQLDAPAMRLSLGQQQRLVLARAIAVEPEVLLMDEPSSALDPLSTLRFEELVHELAGPISIVLVTHNIQQAARVSDYTAYLQGGRLVEFNRTDDLFNQPSQRQTEDYLTGRYG